MTTSKAKSPPMQFFARGARAPGGWRKTALFGLVDPTLHNPLYVIQTNEPKAVCLHKVGYAMKAGDPGQTKPYSEVGLDARQALRKVQLHTVAWYSDRASPHRHKSGDVGRGPGAMQLPAPRDIPKGGVQPRE